MSHKKYKSPNAQKVHDQKGNKPKPVDSKKFFNGSNPHNGGSRGQSGQPKR